MTVLYGVMVEVDPDQELAWNDWHTREHMPELLAQPGFVRATKYRLNIINDGWPQFLTLYEVDSREALEAYLASEVVTRLRAEHYTHFGSSTRISRVILTPTAAVDKPMS
jgi:hypothetical protein